MSHKKHALLSQLDCILNEDILTTLGQLPDNSIDMVYSDPDYNVGVNYCGKKYTMKWAAYMDWYVALSQEALRVLKPTGNLFLINYPKQNAHVRVRYLDEHAYAVHDYVWVFNSNIGHSPRHFTTAHRSILHVRKTKNNHFYKAQVAQPYQNPQDKRIKEHISQGKGRMPYSWLEHQLVKNVSKDKTQHACQIPLGLTETLVLATTQAKDLVFVLFAGSGQELALCQRLKRHFLSCELHPEYYQAACQKIGQT